MKNPAAVSLGRLGGKATSEAKRRAVRENGKLGGRPKKPKRVLDHIAAHGLEPLNAEVSHARPLTHD